MTEKPTEANKQGTQKEKSEKDIYEAIRLVNEAIRKEEERLRKIADTEEQSPICIEGLTMMGYECRLMVDPKDAARILLEYEYPTWTVLGKDCPDAMWGELSRFYGLESVSFIDI